MNRKFKALAFALSMAFVAPSVAMAADSKVDLEIKEVDEKITKLEDEYKSLYKVYEAMRKTSRGYINQKGEIVSNEKAIQENLYKTATELDKYVTNVVPSLEQPMLSVYLMNGAEGNGYTIRKNNAEDLYNYLKSYFEMKEGTNKAEYDRLLREYVNAIYESINLSGIDDAAGSIYKEVRAKKNELDLAKARRKALVKVRDEEKIKDLEKAVFKAKNTLEACKLLIKEAPKKIAGVRDKIDKLMVEQEKLIKAAEKMLEEYK